MIPGASIPGDLGLVLQETAGASNDALAAHVRLCGNCWLMDSLPGDPDTLARMARLPRDRFDQVWAEIGMYYAPSPTDPSRIVHPTVARQKAQLEGLYRVEQLEISEQQELRRKRQEAGRKGGLARVQALADRSKIEANLKQNRSKTEAKPEGAIDGAPSQDRAPVHASDAPAAVSQEPESDVDLFGFSPPSPNGDSPPKPGAPRAGRTLRPRKADGSKMFMPEVPTVELPAELESTVQLFLAAMAENSPRSKITQTRAVITRNELRAILEAVGDPRFLAFAMREAMARGATSTNYVRSVAANAAQRGLSALPGAFKALPKPVAPDAPRKRIEDMNPREFQEYLAAKRASGA